MKRIPRRCRALLLCLAAVMLLGILSGCQSGTDPALRLDKGTSADFARMAADDVTLRRDTPDLLYNAGNLYIDLNQEPVFQPYFAILEFNAVQDEDDPELVHYSCMIPGAVGAVNNAVFNTCFVMNVTYSPFIKLEGTLRVVRDAEGRRCIDVSDADAPNAFTLYAALRYPNPPFFSYNGVDLSGGVTDANRADVMNILLNNASRLYAGAFGQEREAYVNQVVIPQLQSYSSNFQKNISPFRNDWGYGAGNAMTTPVAKIIFWVAIAIAALVAFYFLRKLFRKAKASADWNSKKGRVLQQVAPGITAARRRELAQRCSRFRYDRIVEGNSADVSRLSWPADRAGAERNEVLPGFSRLAAAFPGYPGSAAGGGREGIRPGGEESALFRGEGFPDPDRPG